METEDELDFSYLEDLNDDNDSHTELPPSAHATVADAEQVLPEEAAGLIGLNIVIEQHSQILSELEVLKAEQGKQSELTNSTLQEIKANVLAQATVVDDLRKLVLESQDKQIRILRRTRNMPSQLEALASSIERLQAQESSPREHRQRRQQPSAPRFNLLAVLAVLIAQTVLMVLATIFVIHQCRQLPVPSHSSSGKVRGIDQP